MKVKLFGCLIINLFISIVTLAQSKFNGIESDMSNIFQLSDAKSRSISPENFTGEKGKGGMATKGTNEYNARELGRDGK